MLRHPRERIIFSIGPSRRAVVARAMMTLSER